MDCFMLPGVIWTVEDIERTALRQIRELVDVSHIIVWRTLHNDRIHPYHLHKVQALRSADYAQCVNFAYYYSQLAAVNLTFSADILFTDEAAYMATRKFSSRHCTQQRSRIVHFT